MLSAAPARSDAQGVDRLIAAAYSLFEETGPG
jgi:hypothetical protein